MTFTVKWPRWVTAVAVIALPGGAPLWALVLAAAFWFSDHDGTSALVAISIAVAIGGISYAVTSRVRLDVGTSDIMVVNAFRTVRLSDAEITRIGISFRKLTRQGVPVLGLQTQSGVVGATASYFQSAATRGEIASAVLEFARRNSIPVTLPMDLSRGWGTHGFMGGLHHRDIGAFSPLWDCFIEKPPAWCGVDRRPSSEPPRNFKQP